MVIEAEHSAGIDLTLGAEVELFRTVAVWSVNLRKKARCLNYDQGRTRLIIPSITLCPALLFGFKTWAEFSSPGGLET